MDRIVWKRKPGLPRWDGLVATLREVELGQEVIAEGLKAQDVSWHLRAARRGSNRWYESRTVAGGALIRRCE
jgi:hypothetical protein